MKRLLSLIILIVAAAMAGTVTARTVDEIPNVHIADRTRYVSDPDNVLSPQTVARLDSILGDVWRRTSAEPVVVVVADMSGDDIDSYATEIFDRWSIGKKDKSNGLLVVVSRDDHKAVIRTGYGVEGILPDSRCGRILRDVMFPAFRDDDFDRGITDGVTVIAKVMEHPEAADELMSEYANDAGAGEDKDFFRFYLIMCGVVAAGMLAVLIFTAISMRRRQRYEQYTAVSRLLLPYLVLSFVTLGMGLVPYLLTLLTRRIIRERPCRCPGCGHRMERLDEENDNKYLTPSQDLEERLDSVDYDVWLCPDCGETDILPYVNSHKNYSVCKKCGARAAFLESDRVTQRPTTRHEGAGIRTYHCLNCNQRYTRAYRIPRTEATAAAPIIIGGGSGFGGGGGGGFSGGSFGGGMTGGGGASGGW